jgi:hypothetical protein
MLHHLTNPLVFSAIFAVLSLLLCLGDKCVFKYTVDNKVYYVKIFILVFVLVLGSIYGYKFVNNYINKVDTQNLQTGSAEF